MDCIQDRQIESAARWTPLIILAYFAVQFAIRVSLSANLETDEAQFVGQTFLALGYGNSHPPLYNWLVAGVLPLTGGSWPAALALLKNGLLAGTYLLAFDTARRLTGRVLTGAIVVASFMLLPQIVWKSQITLSHSVLVMFAVVAVLHAIVGIAQRGALADFLWLGLAAGIGALAKYNFFLMLAAALIAALSVPDIRRRLFSAKLAASFAVFAAMFGPHLVWALQNIADSTQRLEKMGRGSDMFGGFDLPLIGIDGFLEYLMAIAAWAGPLLAAWLAIRQLSRREPAAPPPDDERLRGLRLFFGRTALIGGGAFAAILIVGDLHSVHERYLTPILMPLPFWLALALPLEGSGRAPLHVLRIGAVVALLMVTAWPLWILFGREQFAYPYDAITQSLGNAVTGPFAVLGPHDKYAANIAIRLDRATMWEAGSAADQVVVLWEAKAGRSPDGLAARLGDAFEPRGAPLTLHHPYDNLSGNEARLGAQLYARRP